MNAALSEKSGVLQRQKYSLFQIFWKQGILIKRQEGESSLILSHK